MSDCYHCGLPVPANSGFSVVIDGESRPMCCPGCQAVATAIVDGGLEKFYRYRSATSPTPSRDHAGALAHYDLPEIQSEFVRHHEDGTLSADLAVSGITCSACAWLIEHHLSRLEGLVSVTVNVTAHRCRIQWQPHRLALSAILAGFEEIGYEARPAGDAETEQRRTRENRQFLLRLGVAGLGMMQAGMMAVALYAGGFHGIEPQWQQLLRWVSLVIVTPVVLYSAQPFYRAALTSLRARVLVMDVPVALAITLAYAASIWATLTSTGEVYFDSISMFTFFLLLGRYLEMRVRHRNEQHAGSLSRLIPQVAVRVGEGGEEIVPVKSLNTDDVILVRDGETIPCDGEVTAGESDIVEAVLTGEQKPVTRGVGGYVSAGTVNVANPLEIRVLATGSRTRLAAILDLVSGAQSVKPHRAALADRLSAWFVGAVLVIAVLVAGSWLLIDPQRALWVTLSVLVVTCPCALSLATPAALTVATGELKKRGFLIRKSHVLEALAELNRCIFDKTGTLTLGQMQIGRVRPAADVDQRELISVAASLERGSTHPIARAFRGIPTERQSVGDHRIIPGRGVTGVIGGRRYALGSPVLLEEMFGYAVPEPPEQAGLWLVLGEERRFLGSIQLNDHLRPRAAEAVKELENQGIAVELLSGDRPGAARTIAETLHIRQWRGGATPEAKLSRLRQLQGEGEKIMMVGDGINDVPVLSGADISVAMGDAVDLTRLHADCLLVSANLDVLPAAVELARKTGRIIRQNLGWAVLYNLLALPLAAAGLVPPWAAAIGMSFSSLLVVLNALRLSSPEHPAVMAES